MKHETKCELTEKYCGKDCPLWNDCPIEKHDISDYEFVNAVIKYLKERFGINEKGNG